MRKKILIICGLMLVVTGCGKISNMSATPSDAKIKIEAVANYDKDDFKAKYNTIEINGKQFTLPMTDEKLRKMGFGRAIPEMELNKSVWCDIEYTNKDGVVLICSLTCPALLEKASLDECIITKVTWRDGSGECPLKLYGNLTGESTEADLLTYMEDFVDTDNGREYFRYSEEGAGHCVNATVKNGKITTLSVECNDAMYSIVSEDISFPDNFYNVQIADATVELPTTKESLEASGFQLSEDNKLIRGEEVFGKFNDDLSELTITSDMSGAATLIYGMNFNSPEKEVEAKLLNKTDDMEEVRYHMYLYEDQLNGIEVTYKDGKMTQMRIINKVE